MVNVSITKGYTSTPDYDRRLDDALSIMAEMAYRQRRKQMVEALHDDTDSPSDSPPQELGESSQVQVITP